MTDTLASIQYANQNALNREYEIAAFGFSEQPRPMRAQHNIHRSGHCVFFARTLSNA